MLDIKQIIKNKDFYLKMWKRKNFDFINKINELEEKYYQYLKNLQSEEKILADKNNHNQKVKENKKQATIIHDSPLLFSKTKLQEIKIERQNLKKQLDEILLSLPNIPLENVPIGNSEKDNVIIESFLHDKRLFNKTPHWEIIDNKQLLAKDEANEISGTRFVIYKEKLSLLILALERFMLNNNINAGYNLINVPVIVNKKIMENTGQLPKFANDLYKLQGLNNYLIPTAEVPLTNMLINKILKIEELPYKLTASTLCFRKEAGSAGKDTRGLIRLHQFQKVELVKFGKANNEKNDFLEMVEVATRILKALKLPYRIIELCTGDLSFTSRKTYDIEVWMPGSNAYREISSISYIDDFQSRRSNTKYIDENKKKVFVKTYNGSSLAIDRLVAAILENYQDEKNNINIPQKLLEYLTFNKI